jgi:hypothetical protein
MLQVLKRAVNGFRYIRMFPLNADTSTEEDFIIGSLKIVNFEKPVP